jgi:hypothetical protein
MGKDIELTPMSPQGDDLLAQLERETQLLPFKVHEQTGAKTFHLDDDSKVEEFVLTLDRIEPNWHLHLKRAKPPGGNSKDSPGQ